MAAVGRHEQAPVAELAREAATPGRPARTDRGRRRPPGSARRSRAARAAESSGWIATSSAMAGSRRRQAPGPWTGSWRRAGLAAQAGSSRSIRAGSSSRRATLARGSRAGEMPATTSVRTRSGVAGREREAPSGRPSRSRGGGRSQTERVDERGEVVDQPLGAEPVRGVPARAAVAAGIRAGRRGSASRAAGSGRRSPRGPSSSRRAAGRAAAPRRAVS